MIRPIASISLAAALALSAPAAADPASLYAENCASCHGAKLEGQPDWRSPGPDGVMPAPPHDRTGHTWHHGDGMLFVRVFEANTDRIRNPDLIYPGQIFSVPD